jgi:hypothetical protein
MMRVSIRQRFVAVVAAMMALDASGSASQEPATQTRQISMVQEMSSVGLAFGQTLRYTWANLTPAATEELDLELLRLTVRLLADDGSVLAQHSAPAVSPGQFQFVDFHRAQLAPAGDPSTGRVSLRVEVAVVGLSKWGDIELKRGRVFFGAVDVIDDPTGGTSAHKGAGMNELSMDDTAGKEKAASGFQIISAGRDQLIGVVPGQSLRLNASNASEETQRSTLFVAFDVFDADGAVVARSGAVSLEPGQAHSFEVPYAAVSQLADAGGRAQVRTETRRFFNGVVSRVSTGVVDAAPTSLELVDAGTGRTVLLLSSKPKEIVVVGSKIPPR